MNVCKHICFIFFFKFLYNFKDSNACVTFPDTHLSRTKYKSKINKAMFMCIPIMTFNKLNNVYISVFRSDDACLSLIKIL